MRNAWTTNQRIRNVNRRATRSASAYSRATDFRRRAAAGSAAMDPAAGSNASMSADQVPDPLEAGRGQEAEQAMARVPGPVDEHRLALDEVLVEEAPVAGVARVVAVVPHHEEMPGRNDDWTQVVAAVALSHHGIGELGEGLLALDPVDEHLLAADLDGLALGGHTALDEVLLRLARELEDDDVARLGIAEGGEPRFQERHLGAVEELVHEEEVADRERVFHRARGDAERLEEERTDEQEEDEGGQDRLGVL